MVTDRAKNMDNMNREEYIDKYLDGLLSDKEANEFETKCLEDKSFFQQVHEREQLREKVAEVIKKNGKEIFEEYLKEKVAPETQAKATNFFETIAKIWKNVKPIWKYSLVPAGAIAVFILFLLNQPGGSFKPNSELERELDIRPLRSGTFEILSPEIGENIEGTIKFKWQTTMEGPFEVIILNSKAEEIDAFVTNENSNIYDNTLSPGLYYWKFLEDGDWIYTGKFLIMK